MKPKFLTCGLLAAGALLASASLSPAQAAGLRGSLSFEGINPGDNLINSIASPAIDFNNDPGLFEVDAATGGFTQFSNAGVTVNDITDAFSSDFELFDIGGGAGVVGGATFTVKQFIDPVFAGNLFFVSEARGFFTTSEGSTDTASFLLTFNSPGVGADEVDFNLETVPTPALLPGLIGMGVAALRRRKSGDELEGAQA